MADNVNVTEGAGKVIAGDDVGGAIYQRIKVAHGADGSATDTSTANPLPVVQTGTPGLPTGAATAANQTTAIGHLSTIAGVAGDALTDAELRASPVPVIDSNSAALLAAAQAIQTAAQILDNIVAGNEAQVDIVAALPAGTNTIGKAIIVDGAGNDLEFAKEGDNWNAADHGMIIFARDTDTNPDTYRAIQVDPDGHLKVNMPDALPAGTNNIGDVDVLTLPALAAGTNNIGDVDVLTLPALAAGTNYIGTVGARDGMLEITPTLDTNAYTAGDTLFAATEIANAAGASGIPVILNTVLVVDKDDQGAAIDLHFFDRSVTFGTANSAPGISDADAAYYLGHVSLAAADYKDLGGVKVATVRGLSLGPIKPNATSIYVGGVTGGTPTHSASGLVIKFGFMRA